MRRALNNYNEQRSRSYKYMHVTFVYMRVPITIVRPCSLSAAKRTQADSAGRNVSIGAGAVRVL